jgi:hypothetical protein
LQFFFVATDPVENVGDRLFHIAAGTPRGARKEPAAIRYEQSQVGLAVGCFFADGCVASDGLPANNR